MSQSNPGSVTQQLQQAAFGSREAAALLWQRYRRLLYTMAHDTDARPTGAADTSDVVAQTSVRFADPTLFLDVRDRQHFQNLLRQVIRGDAIDQHRRESLRATEEFDGDAHDEGTEDFALLNAEMLDLLEQLPVTQYQTLLVYADHESERATATALGISRDEVRQRLADARTQLLQLLGDAR